MTYYKKKYKFNSETFEFTVNKKEKYVFFKLAFLTKIALFL